MQRESILSKFNNSNVGVLFFTLLPALPSYGLLNLEKITKIIDKMAFHDFIRIFIPVMISVVIYVWLRGRQVKSKTNKYADLLREDASEEMLIHDIVRSRQIAFLMKCVKDGVSYQRPTSWLTKEETRAHIELLRKRTELMQLVNEDIADFQYPNP